MLATALDSHPKLFSKGESTGYTNDMYPNAKDGNVEILQLIGNTPKADRYITLVRHPDDRDHSWQKTTSHHFLAPFITKKELVVNPNRKLKNAHKNQKFLEKFIAENECLVLHYDELTQGDDIREIPEVYGRQICEYLGVEYQPLTPLTYKPVTGELV
jgi:hypothetical protein